MTEKVSYQICNRCIMDTSDREIVFDSNGICNHCRSASEHLLFSQRKIESNPMIFEEVISEIRRNPGRDGFHAIIGVSGGVDSSYLLHVLKKENIKLLAVHVDAGWNSIDSVKNINTMVSALDLELETIVIDWEEMRNLQLAYLKSGVINQDVPQDHAFFSSLYKLARKMKIRYVISGSNYATESILPKSWGQNAMDGLQIRSIYREFGKNQLEKYPITYLRNLYVSLYLFRNYRLVAPLNLINYSKKIAIETLEREYRWQDYGGKHKESRFTDYFQEIYLPNRFQIDKKRAHLSSLIVNDELDRKSALEKLETSKLTELDRSNLENFIASKLGITLSELNKYSKMPYVNDKVFRNEGYLNDLLISLVKIRNTFRKIE